MTEALDKQDQESFKEIDARLQQLCEEKRKLEQMPFTLLQFEVSRDDIKEEIKDEAKDEEDVDVPVEAEEAVLCPLCGLHFKSETAIYHHKYEVHQMSPTMFYIYLCTKDISFQMINFT